MTPSTRLRGKHMIRGTAVLGTRVPSPVRIPAAAGARAALDYFGELENTCSGGVSWP